MKVKCIKLLNADREEIAFAPWLTLGQIYYVIKERLLDDLSELDETAYKRFLEIIKAEGLVDQDFY